MSLAFYRSLSLTLALSCLSGTQINAEEMKNEPQVTHRVCQFENEYVRVWKTVIMPHQPLKMHRHDDYRVIVPLAGGTLTKIEENGDTSPLVFENGRAYWLEPDPVGTLHGDINESDEPIVVMGIEVKKEQAPKP